MTAPKTWSQWSGWWRTVGVLVGLELRQRTRATRWKVLLGVFFVAVSVLIFGSLWFASSVGNSVAGWSTNLYFFVVGFVGFLGLVIAPTTTATAINGDRKDATLAVVQATPATGWQVATGKLLGAWLASTALIVVTLPYFVWAIVAANYPVYLSILGIVVLDLLFLAYCGIGLGFSALFARPIGSAAVTQLTVLFLFLGMPAIAGLLTPATETTVTAMRPQWDYNSNGDSAQCRVVPTEVTVTHTERIWWILAPNPAVVMADAAAHGDRGRIDPDMFVRVESSREYSVMYDLARSVAEIRTGPGAVQDERCAARYLDFGYDEPPVRPRNLGHTWYWGLLANLAFGALGLAFAARRLRVPARNLPRGIRIA